ncbi:lysophospholipid acyltransferase family protein [Novipirellula artificiosorum]|uniref:Acyltransferase n=1 Tax=Novipirellula artificiosorum TaxID=2528016 RepID=A0A5C6D3Z0_9BACT|nr:1-acyl-sn-glycerol-3-phosphate acyltransferase [Novipirellula artificiosorum]TWU31530.1 Acyltransferase [Novipirellula artificiosorum]
MTVILDRPYQFIPPCRNDLWPGFIQRFRLFDYYLRKKEGVVSFDCRNLEVLRESLDAGDGILLAPNHCRYADPLVMGWPARMTKRHVYAMASWHLFNKHWFDSFAIQRMGGFSVFREGPDRQALETAIDILVEAHRPLILFPEGTTNRTNDVLKPLLDGVTFIARTAARRRAKRVGGKVVIHPVAIKYLCTMPIDDWAHHQLQRIEQHLGWQKPVALPLLERTLRVAEALLGLREVEYRGRCGEGTLPQRRDALIEHVLCQAEQRLQTGVAAASSSNFADQVRARVRAIRSEVHSRWFSNHPDEPEKRLLRGDVAAADMAQDLLSYPDGYLNRDSATDTRVVETIQRMQETLFGKADVGIPLHSVVELSDAIEVPAEKAPRGIEDPLITGIRDSLNEMLGRLSQEARPIG